MRKETTAIKVITMTSIAVFVLAMSLGLQSSIASSSDEPISLRLVNAERLKTGLNRLEWSQNLANAAQKKAQDMIENKYFDHISPQGKMVWGYILQEGYNYSVAGENLAIDYSDIGSAYNAWMKSKSHRDNILSDKYSEFGFAQLNGKVEGHDTTVLVQLFGDR